MTPRPYQIVGRDFLAGKRHALLADEMRVGKTPQAILACEAVAAKRVCVLCPAIAVPHWRREFATWWPGNTVELDVMSYDHAVRHRARYADKRWDVLIADEAHYAKNPGAKRTGVVYGKKGFGWQADRIWALSGTPAPRHAGELWPMLRAFGVVGMTDREFYDRFCRCVDGVPVGTKEERIPELRELLAKVMLRRRRVDVMPDATAIEFMHLPVEPAVKLLAEERGLPGDMDADTMARYLSENTAHLAEWRIAVAMAKVPPLQAEIETALGGRLIDQTVVFGVHIDPLTFLCNGLIDAGFNARMLTGKTPAAEREKIIAGFAAGDVDVICANIIAAGTAIDLSAAHHGYFLEMDWVPGNNVQAANRLIALDKPRPVSYDIVSWHGSFDDRIQRSLARRTRELSQLY